MGINLPCDSPTPAWLQESRSGFPPYGGRPNHWDVAIIQRPVKAVSRKSFVLQFAEGENKYVGCNCPTSLGSSGSHVVVDSEAARPLIRRGESRSATAFRAETSKRAGQDEPSPANSARKRQFNNLKKLKGWSFMLDCKDVAPAIISAATHEGTGRKRGPVPKRRYQKGSFQVQNGKAYTLFYRDVEKPDGTITTERTRHLIGDLSVMSERAARREHDLFMANVNRRRGSVPAAIRGETFKDAVDAWKKDVAPQLSPATVRQRESYLRTHALPAFAKEAPHALDVRALQRFATTLQNDLSPKTVINILETIFAVLRYAKKCGTRTSPVSFSDLTIRNAESPERPFFTAE